MVFAKINRRRIKKIVTLEIAGAEQVIKIKGPGVLINPIPVIYDLYLAQLYCFFRGQITNSNCAGKLFSPLLIPSTPD